MKIWIALWRCNQYDDVRTLERAEKDLFMIQLQPGDCFFRISVHEIELSTVALTAYMHVLE